MTDRTTQVVNLARDGSEIPPVSEEPVAFLKLTYPVETIHGWVWCESVYPVDFGIFHG